VRPHGPAARGRRRPGPPAAVAIEPPARGETPAATPDPGRIALAVAAGIAAALLYAGQFVISRLSLRSTLTPWDLAVLRFAVAGPLMLPVLVRHGWADAAGIGWRRATVLAISVGAPFTLFIYAGLVWAPAGHGAVIVTGATPVVSALLAWRWFGDRPSPARVLGLLAIVAGLLLVSSPGLGGGGERRWLGDLCFAAAALLWGIFPALTRRWRVDPGRGTAVVWVLSLAYVPIYLLVFGTRVLAAPRVEICLQAAYQGLGVAVAALALYAWAVRVLGVSIGSLFMPLVPVFGVGLAVPVLGEIPTALQLVGIGGVCLGMALTAVYTSSHSRRTPSLPRRSSGVPSKTTRPRPIT
jgi:drug/metabolite transporter (DMT)-like permease